MLYTYSHNRFIVFFLSFIFFVRSRPTILMTSYETRLTQPNSAGTKGSLPTGNGQNNVKKLKSKYASKLSTLKELFEDWSDEDLLFALQDADGDLELTIERISAGHAVQWGEVKSKKSKKEAAQKAKAAAVQPATLSTTAYSPRTERTQIPRNNNERGRGSRGGSTSTRSARGKPTATSQQPSQIQAASWGKQMKPAQSSERAAGGSWASIASAPKPPDALDEPTTLNDSLNTTSTNATDGWPATTTRSPDDTWAAAAKPSWDDNEEPANPTPSLHTEQKPPIPTANSSTTTSSAPKTWASLLKSKPAPEPETKPAIAASEEQAVKDSWNAPAEDTWSAPTDNDGWDTEAKITDKTTTTDPWTEPDQPTSFGSALLKEDIAENTKDEQKQPPPQIPETLDSTTEEPMDSTAEAETANDKEQTASSSSSSSPSPLPQPVTVDSKVRQSVGRRLRQDEPVVLPNSATLSGVDVKFGTLSLEDSTVGSSVDVNSRLNEHDKQDQVQVPDEKPTSVEPQQSYLNRYTANAPAAVGQTTGLATSEAFADQASYLKQQQQETIHAQQQQQQQQSQQQVTGMDHLTSAYNSYMPNQQVAGVPGYGVNPMGSVPDYGVYGTDAQRAAMGYYDPNSFDHYSPSVSSGNAYQMRDKYNQETSANQSSMQPNAQQTQAIPQQAQQMYPNMPYYQYYYMPNQFGAYQHSTYGQPFLNKSMYQMYQGSSKPSSASTSNTPYNAQQAQHLYNQSLSGAAGPTGYDDMSGLHQQFGSGNMGLHDYQKPSSYGSGPQIPGFLGGNLSGATAQQQPQQQAVQQAAGAQQTQGKPDPSNGQYKPGGSQQPGMPNPSNYFSHQQQQQMAYTQHSQQFPVPQHMDSAQQLQQGRQQQYWTQ
ncbi:hypothetical protein BDB00DRAFT_802119 [Zychaea mexicana]|uniref:uncharacterized protein n=1 Tax=Zychaea mexicana TaxID=64656 RepID=UPI0022FF1075|nr:uncharacterized protein BDB00DRAFT_802119 [Zychaea mexicana]KAI9497842.1 hypothetical protein BDB00DRAFT_802119 [Zychaea mexicana]